MPTPPPLRTPPLFIVFNPGSGPSDAVQVHRTIEEGCSAAGRELHLLTVDGTNSLGAIAAEAVRRGVGLRRRGGGGRRRRHASMPWRRPRSAAAARSVCCRKAPSTISAGRTASRPTPQRRCRRCCTRSRRAGAGRAGQRPALPGQRQPRPVPQAAARIARRSRRDSAAAAWSRWSPRWSRCCAAPQPAPRYRLAGSAARSATPTLFVGNNALQLEQLGMPRAPSARRGRARGHHAAARRHAGDVLAAAARRLRPARRRPSDMRASTFHRLTVHAARGRTARGASRWLPTAR